MGTKVKVGSKAYIFHDQSTGITIKKGEIKELTPQQYNSKRIRSAINGGHLVITNENIEKEIKKDVKVDNKKAIEKFKEMVESGMTSEKIAKAFNLETLKTMAASFDIEVTDEERNSELETIANTYNRDLEEIKQIFAQNMYQIDADILNRKALDVVKENLKK